MEKFNRTLRGYDPEEVNNFLDKVINQVEQMVDEIKDKDKRIKELESLEKENQMLKEKIVRYEHMEHTLNRAIMMAQKTSEQIKMNANRIINEALLKAEKAEQDANTLQRNINIFKRRVKDIVEAQLEVVSELDDVEL